MSGFDGTMKSLERMRKDDLVRWAASHCLLEWCDDPYGLTKESLVREVRRELASISYYLENAAAANGTVRTKGDVWAHIGATW